jgi:hypothetical protein
MCILFLNRRMKVSNTTAKRNIRLTFGFVTMFDGSLEVSI